MDINVHGTRSVKRRAVLARNYDLYLMLLLPLLWYVIFCYVPMYGVQIAFRFYMPSKGFLGSTWVGWRNFHRFFASYYFARTVLNTIFINLYALLAGFPIPILFALALNEVKGKVYKGLLQNATYIPHFLSAVVIVSILQLLLNLDSGVINVLAKDLGFRAQDFLSNPAYFKHIYVWSGIWQNLGWDSIIYIAALGGIDPSLYEAASIDGCSKIQKMLHISLPGIMPTIVILFILACGQIMNIGFEKILLMQNSLNMSSSDVISTLVYRMGILGDDYSFSTAVGLFNSVCNFILLLLVNFFAKHLGETSLW